MRIAINNTLTASIDCFIKRTVTHSRQGCPCHFGQRSVTHSHQGCPCHFGRPVPHSKYRYIIKTTVTHSHQGCPCHFARPVPHSKYRYTPTKGPTSYGLLCASRQCIKGVPAATGNRLCLLHANIREETHIISFTRSSYRNQMTSILVEHSVRETPSS